MKKLIVSKFGGGSIRTPQGLFRCANIFLANPARKVAVLSATYNSTNKLEEMAKLAFRGDIALANKKLAEFLDLQTDFSKKLDIEELVSDFFNKIVIEAESLLLRMNKNPSLKSLDSLLSIGERFSSYLFFSLLKKSRPDHKFYYLDARDIIKTDSDSGQAKPDMVTTKKNCLKLLEKIEEGFIIITQGFIGSDANGDTTTLGREGSDYSASLFAYGLGSDQLEIWKDVSGLYHADPKVVEKAKKITELSFDEATKLAESGAKVLFPKTLNPLREKEIPVYIGSTINPKIEGTWIKKEITKSKDLLGISYVKDALALKVFPKENVDEQKLGQNLKAALLENKLNVYHFHVRKGEANLIINTDHQLMLNFRKMIDEFSNHDFFDNYSLITLLGSNLSKIEKKIFKFQGEVVENGQSIEILRYQEEKIELLAKKKSLDAIMNHLYGNIFS